MTGYLQSPYRVGALFGAAVRSGIEHANRSRCAAARCRRYRGRAAPYGAVPLFLDTWGIGAHTAELGYSRHWGDRWLVDGYVRYYRQDHALFYIDNFTRQ